MKRPVVIDGRNCYSRDAAQKAGIAYDCIGRPRILPRSWTDQAGRVLSLPVHSRKTASASVMSLQTSV